MKKNSSLQAISRLNVSQQQAHLLIDQAFEIAEKLKFHIAVAVVDWSGDLVAFSRADAAAKITIDVAMGKAKTAALIQNSSKLFEDFIQQDHQSSLLSIDTLMPLQGGLPIFQQQQIIGAIGVSGCPGGQYDQQIAEQVLEQLEFNAE